MYEVMPFECKSLNAWKNTGGCCHASKTALRACLSPAASMYAAAQAGTAFWRLAVVRTDEPATSTVTVEGHASTRS